MSLGDSYSNLWPFGYCAWCHINVQKSHKNVAHKNHRSADFFCLYLLVGVTDRGAVYTKMILIDSTIYAIPKNLRNVKFLIWLEISTYELCIKNQLHVILVVLA